MSNQDSDSLRAALVAAQTASAAKSRLISHASHEIRTQLAGVLGLAQAAQETRLTPDQQEFFDLIVTSGDALLTLVNDLLDLSKMEAGMLAVDRIPFGLWDAVDHAVTTFGSVFEEKGLTLTLERGPGVPDRVTGDPGRIRQVLANLLGNAVRFTDTGETIVRVLAADQSDDTTLVTFEVSDSGVGIPSDRLSAIFDPYSQADASVARTRGGSGLGLSIARQLVELMGGELVVRSVVGEGSTFSFAIPVGHAVESPVPSEPVSRSGLVDLPMLVVSDHASLVRDALQLEGSPIDMALDTDEMNKLLSNALDMPYALLVIEGPGGLEVARELRLREALDTTHLLILTAAGERGDAAICRELRVGGYLTTPYSSPDIAAAAQEVLAGPAPTDLTILVTRHWLRERRTRLSILVVDDSPTLRMTSSRLLERRGHSVRTVGGGAAAIEAVEAHRYDAIVMDINMPDMDGFEATERIRQSDFGADIPIVAVSSQATDEATERIIAAGASELLARPFEVFDLVAAIERALVGGSI